MNSHHLPYHLRISYSSSWTNSLSFESWWQRQKKNILYIYIHIQVLQIISNLAPEVTHPPAPHSARLLIIGWVQTHTSLWIIWTSGKVLPNFSCVVLPWQLPRVSDMFVRSSIQGYENWLSGCSGLYSTSSHMFFCRCQWWARPQCLQRFSWCLS